MVAEGANPLVSVVTLLAAAVVAVPLFKRLGLGSVLGYLAAGLVIGPFGFGLFTDPGGNNPYSRIRCGDVFIHHWTRNETLSYLGTT